MNDNTMMLIIDKLESLERKIEALGGIPEWIDVKRFAELTSMSEAWVRRQCQEGKIASTKLGKGKSKHIISREEYYRVIEERKG